ncbi:MAG: DNA alkylation repair protein [Candidatus Methanoplasma sp.]|jgi:3-methyladenine DNA glycosylase AlkD|nr:DNA alkylation repair protein [Candidatus Methanoplasma sp.]
MIDPMAEILGSADPKRAEFQRRTVPGMALECHGAPMPALRRIAGEICRGDWRAFLSSEPRCEEEVVLRALVIAGADMGSGERLRRTEAFLPEVTDWAVCDTLCGGWRIDGAEGRDALWRMCESLIGSGDGFRMRVAAVMMLCHFLDDAHIDGVLSMLSEAGHPEYYFRMGSAWALSSAYVRYPEKTEAALFSGRLDPWIRNKAVQKIRESYRVSGADKERLRERNRLMRAPRPS